MTIFDVLTMIGGLCLFLFGMNLMGEALERRAGRKLQSILGKLTTGKIAGLLTGLCITGVIQSSSATTVMVVGFVNSGIMTLQQAINVIMGANIGTTVTAWILSLGGIQGDNLILQLLKPSSFSPILALAGIVLYMFGKKAKQKDTGTILLGFATLMFGMETMTGAVSGLADNTQFQQLFVLFQNPVLGVLAGAILTAIIQSSSASVGILQALTVTGQISVGAAIPIIMGQNIGTCITAILSSFGTNKNAKRAAMVHLSFNVIGTAVWLSVFCIADAIFAPALFATPINHAGIAIAHSLFNCLCTMLLLPMSSLLEKLAFRLVPEDRNPEEFRALDERLLLTPAIAIERSRQVTGEMVVCAWECLNNAISCIRKFDPQRRDAVMEAEERTDKYEDLIGSYLVKLSAGKLDEQNSTVVTKLLKTIGDMERIADHAVNLAESAQELSDKELTFTPDARKEMDLLLGAVQESMDLIHRVYVEGETGLARSVEPLESVVDELKDTLRDHHIHRLQKGLCSVEAGFVWSDLLTDLERISDHCSNVAACIVDEEPNVNIHEFQKHDKGADTDFQALYTMYHKKYRV